MDLDEAVIVALGSNLPGEFDSSEALLDAALASMVEAGLPIVRRSSWWRSAAWPDPTRPEYRNGVALVEAQGGPADLLQILFSIEEAYRRVRGGRNEARTLDLDLVAYGRLTIDQPGLILPHPRAHERRFVMGPLAEIAPAWRHPRLGASAAELAARAAVGADARPA